MSDTRPADQAILPSTCAVCSAGIERGDRIVPKSGGWAHRPCAEVEG